MNDTFRSIMHSFFQWVSGLLISCQELCWARAPASPKAALEHVDPSEQGTLSGQMNYKSWAQDSKCLPQLAVSMEPLPTEVNEEKVRLRGLRF